MRGSSDADESTSSTPRTVVLGFDALAFQYLDEFAADLPHFGALRERAIEAPLRSTFPPWTASAWPSMYTGTDPSHHGVFTFFEYGDRYPDAASTVTRRDVERPALWDYCSAQGIPSIVLNMPVTHPADPIDGVLIPGFMAPEDGAGHPETIRAELNDAVGEYRINPGTVDLADKETKLDGYVEQIDGHRRAAEYLLANYDWRLAVVQVQETDSVFHNFDDPMAFRRVYRAADRFLGAVLDVVDEDVNVVVCSDHGMGSDAGYWIYPNEVLRRHGYVETTADDARTTADDAQFRFDREAPATGNRADRGATTGSTLSNLPARAVPWLAATLDRVGVTPADVYSTVRRFDLGPTLRTLLPAGAIESAGAALRAVEAREQVDWRASKAYCRNGSEFGVRINLEGREPDGVVPKERYDSVREDLIEVLNRLETPDGRPAFEWVRRREDVYDGPATAGACDVLFMPTDMRSSTKRSLPGKRFVQVDMNNHKRNGAFIGAGPAFDTSVGLERLSLTDVAPIVMATLGCDVPARMTGVVPDGLLTVPVSRAEYTDVEFATGTDERGESDRDQVTERLEDLGYL